MCGIVGIVSFDGRPVDESRLTRMRDLLRHRGPDAAGLWTRGGVGFGHRRLSIIDVSGGHQPMVDDQSSVCLVYNGEIYNHVELRSDLESRGRRYRTRCDTETILRLYEVEGDRLVERLKGMFAFALWDPRCRRLLLARDRLGIKPLYYCRTAHELVFASEIKAILASGVVQPRLRVAAIPEYLATRFVSGEETFFEGIHKLLPGHILTWSQETGVSTRPYWKLPDLDGALESGSFASEAADLERRLDEAVQRHLMSDVPLGVFLSGGVDSSAIAAFAARTTRQPIQTFSVGFAEPGMNELPYARLVAEWLGTEHRDVTVSANEFLGVLPRLVWHEDEPIAFSSSVPLYFVSELASRHVKVVLTGEGADELFLGYNRYRVTFWNERLGRIYWRLAPGKVCQATNQLVGALPRFLKRYATRTFLALKPGPRSLFFDNFAVFSESFQEALVDGYGPGIRDPYRASLECYGRAGGSLLDRMSRSDLHTYLHELLMKQDQMSMAASIESRVPFLDDDVVERVTQLPSHFKLRGWQTKAILRAAVRDLLPREILTRSKMGFPVPVRRWFRERFGAAVDEFVLGPRALARGIFREAPLRQLVGEHRTGQVDHGEKLWLLLNFEMWQRLFCEGEAVGDLTKSVWRHLGRGGAHAHTLGQNGGAVAAQHRRQAAVLSNPVGTQPAP